MSARLTVFTTFLVAALSVPLAEAQQLKAYYWGRNAAGHAVWNIEVQPLVQSPAGALAVELPFTALSAGVVNATRNAAWPYDNPGFNPFTNAITFGLYVAPTAVFFAAGSDLIATGAPVSVLQIVTTQPGSGRFGIGWNHAVIAQSGAAVTTCGSARAAVYSADFDGDGDVDGADFVVWQSNFPRSSGATKATGDADGDGDVDGADFVAWQVQFPSSPPPPLTADFDGDADVDGNDLMIWQQNSGRTSGATRCQGDSDNDGDVDNTDLNAWQQQFGT